MTTTISIDLESAARLLKAGECVAIPTETVYGLGANALDENAVVKIFEAKNRPFFDPLIVHISDSDQMNKFTSEIPPIAKKLADAFWPGPLTLLLPKSDAIPYLVTSGLDTVGLRVPNHPLALSLLRSLPFPLAAPSANPFGYISPTTAQHVLAQLAGRISMVLDGGPCGVGVESTIVQCTGDVVSIVRLGGLCVEDIESVAGKVNLQLNASANPMAPGQLSSHYA
ncbi:MAG: L-threonylcarbamoyladenylate synthase, partial [Flavobacteriales bacterium]